jgi:hypothetical protein
MNRASPALDVVSGIAAVVTSVARLPGRAKNHKRNHPRHGFELCSAPQNFGLRLKF